MDSLWLMMYVTLWWTYKKLLKMAIEIVRFPINSMVIFHRVKLPEGNQKPSRKLWKLQTKICKTPEKCLHVLHGTPRSLPSNSGHVGLKTLLFCRLQQQHCSAPWRRAGSHFQPSWKNAWWQLASQHLHISLPFLSFFLGSGNVQICDSLCSFWCSWESQMNRISPSPWRSTRARVQGELIGPQLRHVQVLKQCGGQSPVIFHRVHQGIPDIELHGLHGPFQHVQSLQPTTCICQRWEGWTPVDGICFQEFSTHQLQQFHGKVPAIRGDAAEELAIRFQLYHLGMTWPRIIAPFHGGSDLRTSMCNKQQANFAWNHCTETSCRTSVD